MGVLLSLGTDVGSLVKSAASAGRPPRVNSSSKLIKIASCLQTAERSLGTTDKTYLSEISRHRITAGARQLIIRCFMSFICRAFRAAEPSRTVWESSDKVALRAQSYSLKMKFPRLRF